jgi:hypothetical protein
MAKHTPARQLFDLLISQDFDPELLDVAGKPAKDPAEAELFNFDFRAESGKDYGTVVILLGDENNLEVYYGDNVGRTMEGSDKDNWFAFLEQLKQFSVKNFMDFSPKNINRLRYSMQTQAAIKEGLFESWSGTKTTSWNGKQTEARLMIRHKKTLGETDARYRYIESLFVETAEGERYKLPFTKLSGGRAMVEHVRNGGKPYDIRGQHIATIVEEINVLSRFRKANQGKLLEGDTAELVEDVNRYYESLHRNLKTLATKTGYKNYFESWNPADIPEEEVVVEGLKHLFVTQSIDDRIESALPLLARIQQQGTAMKEANIFESWAESLVEGTWQLPDTPEKQNKLIELMQADLPVGADATNATEQLYDLLGDDHLFDQLEELAERDANADARQVIYDRLQELADHPDVRKVTDQLQIDDQVEMNPPESTPADLGSNKQEAPEHVPGAQGKINKLAESRMIDEDKETLDHILDRFRHEVRNFEQGGDLDKDLYDALYDYYCDTGDMPYGVQKARDGDPMEWVASNLESHLRGGGIVGGAPDEDYAVEREGVEEEYEDPLAKILRTAGVPAGKRAAPVYNHSTMEEDNDDSSSGILPLAAAGGLGYAAGSGMLDGVGSALAGLFAEDEQEETDEGILGTLGGALAGGGLGAMVGGALGGPAGAIAGQGVGAAVGGVGGQEMTKGGSSIIEDDKEDKDDDSIWPELAAGALGAGLGYAAGSHVPAGSVEVTGAPDIGSSVSNAADSILEKDELDTIRKHAGLDQEETDEGWKGKLAGGVAGSMAGELAGAPLGPLGVMAGGALGGIGGSMLGDKLGGPDEEETTEDTSPLAGKYGHSGKMKEVGKDTSFLDRLKELSGMKRN